MITSKLRRTLASAAVVSLFVVGQEIAAAPTVTPVDAAGLKRAVAAKKGKVVVVNFWATWCVPCVQEFPDLVRLRDKYRKRGMELVTVSHDQARVVNSQVVPFLAKHRVTSGAYLQKGDAEAFMKGVDPTWKGAIPRTLIYGRDGKLMKRLEGKQSLAVFEKAVTPLLAKR